MVVDDLAAHDPMQVSLHRRQLASERLNILIRDHAHLRVLEGDRVDAVQSGVDAVDTHQITGHLKSGDLLAALARTDHGLEEASPDLKQGIEAVARSKQRLSVGHLAQTGHETVVDAFELAFAKTCREADPAQMTGGALHLARAGRRRNRPVTDQ